MKIPSLLSLTLLAACATHEPALSLDEKSELAAAGKADGFDYCSYYDWYDDDFCDDPYGWCAQPDPDCGPDGDSCAEGYSWSGASDEGCVQGEAPVDPPAEFTAPQVIGSRPSTSFDTRAWASVAVDAAGEPHVAYVNRYRKLTYANAADNWTPHVLDSSRYVQEGLSITAASEDLRIAYVDASYRLQYLVVNDSVVSDQREAVSRARSIGMAELDGDSLLVFGAGDTRPTLAASLGSQEGFAAEGIHDIENVTEAPESPAVATDAFGEVHVAYGTRPAAFNTHSGSQIRYAHRDSAGQWTEEFIHSATYAGGGIAVDGAGSPFAVFKGFVDGHQTLLFAEKNAGSWQTSPVLGAGISGRSANIAVSESGVVHIVYWTNEHILQYISRDQEGIWSAPIELDAGVTMGDAERIGIALAQDGALHIVYSDTVTREVRYLSRD